MENKKLSFVGMRLKGRRLIDTLTTHLSPTNHPLKHGIGKYIFSFLLVLAMSIGQMWGATTGDPEVVSLTSGNITAAYAKEYAVTTDYDVLADGAVYATSRNAITANATNGIEPNYMGILFKPLVNCKVVIKGVNTTTSTRNFGNKVFEVDNTDIYPMVKASSSYNGSISKYLLNNYSSYTTRTQSGWKDVKLIKYSSNKYQEDATNAAKTITGESAQSALYTQVEGIQAVAITPKASSGAADVVESKTISTATAEYVFQAGKTYAMYVHRNSSGVYIKEISFVPVYQLTWALDGGSITSAADAYTNAGYYAAGTALTAPTVEKSGFDFSGWSPTVAATMPAAATTYTATWSTADTYDATFANGGHGTAPSKAEGVSSVTLAEITGVAGWKNTGWTADVATKVGTTDKAVGAHLDNGATVTLLENTTFTAEWAQLYTVTYNKAGGEGGDVPTQDALQNGETFDVAGQGTLTAPTAGYIFRGWSDGIASYPYEEGDDYTINSTNVSFTAVWEAPVTYTVALDANGGTIASYDGWDIEGNVYSKTVTEGTEVSLLAFTKSGLQLMFFRDGDDNEYSSSVTLNSNLNLKAIWGKEKEVELYYWEGKEGGAIERGGTAVTKNASETVGANADINVSNGGYYTLRLNGNTDYSGGSGKNYIEIALDQAVKTGDVVTFTGYANKNDKSKKAGVKMATGSGTVIFAESTQLPDIGAGDDPEERNYTVPAGVDADVVKLTRALTGTNSFLSKIAITGTRVVEEMDPAEQPTITTQPTGGTYAWNADATQTVVATVSDGGTLSYQWYKKGDTDTKVGTNSASYVPTVSGTYYVIVTNTKTGYAKTTKKSNEVSVTINERPSYKVTYYDGAVKLGEETVNEGAKPTHAGDFDDLPMATFQGWFNDADLAPEHAVASIGDEVITAATSYYSKWNKTYASSVDFLQFIADNTTSGDYAAYLSTNGYLLTQGTGHENALDNSNAFDTGLKLKTSTDTKLQFNVAAGKIIKLTVGKINGMSIAINGAAATAIASGTDATHLGVSYYYSANAQAVTIAETATKYNIIKVIEFLDPMTVTYDATTNGGSCETASATFTGTALTLPEATKSGWAFDGWFTTANDDTETGVLVGEAGDTYTPSANITLYARFTETTTLATLTDIKVNGTTVEGFAIDKFEYNIVLPYKTSVVPTVAYTKGYSGATVTMTPSTITSVFGDVTLHVVSQDESNENDYVLHITEAPKDMLCLIQATHTGAKAATVTGYIGGTADKDTQGDSKLGSKGHYFGIQLTSGTFQAGDVVLLRTAVGANTNGDKVRIFKSNSASAENVLVEGTEAMIYGDNYVTLPETSLNQLYLRRGTNDEAYNTGWNPWIAVFAVYRPYPNPLVGSMAINSIDVTVNNAASTKTITGVMPSGTNFASLSISNIVYLSNNPSETDGVLSGSWNELTSQYEGTFTVTDKDFDVTVYTVTLTEDVAVESVTISGETTVAAKSQITLTATVLPAGVANKNVIWSSSDASKATVDANGVVTGKAAGNVTITATSVADGTIKDTYAITVTPFVGTERAYWFVYAADATANGVTNNSDVFGSAPTGSNNGGFEISLEEGWTVTTTKKVGSTSSFGTFTVPADFTATWYAAVKAGGNGRVLNMKQGDVVKYSVALANDADPEIVKIENIAAGTYDVVLTGASSISQVYLFAAELNSYPLTSVAIEDGFNLRLGNSRTPVITANPAKAAIVSQTWSIVSQTGAADAELNTTTGVITAGTEEGTMTVKVTVTDILGNEVESGNCVVNIVNVIDQQPVTGSVTWNWNELSMSSANITEGAPVLANYIEGDKWAMLKGTVGDKAYNTPANGSYEGKGTLSFTTTVPGLVTITARSWNNSPNLKIGDQAVINSLSGSTKVSKPFFVPAGEVVISASNANDGMRIMKIEFDADLTTDKIDGSFFEGYTRDVRQGYYGTICLPNGGVMVGASIFELAYYSESENKIFMDRVMSGEMVAGRPYIFLPYEGVSTLGVYYTDEATVAAGDYRGLYGYYDGTDNSMELEPGDGHYILYQNQFREVTDSYVYIDQNRAYFKIGVSGGIPTNVVAPLPGRMRMAIGAAAPKTPTGIEEITNDQLPMNNKVLINGQLFILRGEKMYDATGRLVK